MELHHLRCFVAVAETLHFGQAAHNLNILPSALGRYIKLLEDDLGTRLLVRSTRNVMLTDYGAQFLPEARKIIADADELQKRFQNLARRKSNHLRIGAIDSVVVGLVPHVLSAFCARYPDVDIHITEDKTSKLLPKLKSGRLDVIFARSVPTDNALENHFLFYENVALVVHADHPLAHKSQVRVSDLADVPLIVPERKARPHSHDLTTHLFANSAIPPRLLQLADEKLTILNMVAARLGAAIMPSWVTQMSALRVKSVPLAAEFQSIREKLPVSALWLKHSRDEWRDKLMNVVAAELPTILPIY
ncbi:LysR family transcriptional regulator [Aggregatibacter kilianii]|uniref:LysR family transcriptional regulator n=1 Tax=Aggregatibacter kilianii TaxID=2025884 RepID=UPI000D65D650|nr:LysR substrate-binding domain-containing protein [Aggregatibacter kilianii]